MAFREQLGIRSEKTRSGVVQTSLCCWRIPRSSPSEKEAHRGFGVSSARPALRGIASDPTRARAKLAGFSGGSGAAGAHRRGGARRPALPGHRRFQTPALSATPWPRHRLRYPLGPRREGCSALGSQPAQLRGALRARARLAVGDSARAGPESGGAGETFGQEPELGVAAPGSGPGVATDGPRACAPGEDPSPRGNAVSGTDRPAQPRGLPAALLSDRCEEAQ